MKKKLLTLIMMVCMAIVLVPAFVWGETGGADSVTTQSWDGSSKYYITWAGGEANADTLQEAFTAIENDHETNNGHVAYEITLESEDTGTDGNGIGQVTVGDTKSIDGVTIDLNLNDNGIVINEGTGFIKICSGTLNITAGSGGNGFIVPEQEDLHERLETSDYGFYNAWPNTNGTASGTINFKSGRFGGDFSEKSGTAKATDGGNINITGGYYFLDYDDANTDRLGAFVDTSAFSIDKRQNGNINSTAEYYNGTGSTKPAMCYVSDISTHAAELVHNGTTKSCYSINYAFEQAQDGDTIRLISNATADGTAIAGKPNNNPELSLDKDNVTLDLNGMTIESRASVVIDIGGTVSVVGDSNGTAEGTIKCTYSTSLSNKSMTAINVSSESEEGNAGNLTIKGKLKIDFSSGKCKSSNAIYNGNQVNFDNSLNDTVITVVAGTAHLYGIYQATSKTVDADNSNIIVKSESEKFETYGIYFGGTVSASVYNLSIDMSGASGDVVSCASSDNNTNYSYIYSGKYKTNTEDQPLSGNVLARGGYYSTNLEIEDGWEIVYFYDTANGYKCIANPDKDTQGKYGYGYDYMVVGNYVAKSSSTPSVEGYTTLQEAINATTDGGTVKMLRDATDSHDLSSSGSEAQFKEGDGDTTNVSVILDMAGYNITANMPNGYPLFIENEKVTIIGSGEIKNTNTSSGADAIHICSTDGKASLTFGNGSDDGSNIKVTTANDSNKAIKIGWEGGPKAGTVNIAAGSYYGLLEKYDSSSDANMTSAYHIRGGYYTDGELMPDQSKDEFVDDGYVCINNPDSNKATYPYKVVPKVKLVSASITAYESIQPYFKVSAVDATAAAGIPGNYSVKFTVTHADGSSPTVTTQDITDSNLVEGGTYKNHGNVYEVAAPRIPVKQIGDNIRAELVLTANPESVYDVKDPYSIKDYCYNIGKNTSKSSQARDNCYALLNYGGQAQQYFKYDTDNIVSDEVEGSYKTIGQPSSQEEITSVKRIYGDQEGTLDESTFLGQTLTVESDTKITFYLNLDKNKSYKAEYSLGETLGAGGDIKTAEIAETKDVDGATHYVEIGGIVSTQLRYPYTLKITETGGEQRYRTINYSVATWVYNHWNDVASESALTTPQALGKTIIGFNDTSVTYAEYVNSK